MFDSGMTVKDLFGQISSEADIAPDIKDEALVNLYNGLIVGLYRDIVRNEVYEEFDLSENTVNLGFSSGDIYRVFDSTSFEAEKVNPVYALTTNRVCWFASGKEQIVVRNFPDDKCIVFHYEMPDTADTVEDEMNVPVPIDFIDMVKAKIRGDMYNLSNDDDLAAKWYGVYNARLEDFKMFVANIKEEVHG